MSSIFIDFGSNGSDYDTDESGVVDLPDLNRVFTNFGMAGDN
jgi:hypothetical protein